VGLRFACARLGAISVIALAACTTTLSYTYDAGPDGSTSGSSGTSGTSGSSGTSGTPTPGFPSCAQGVAQFCDNFDGTTTKWPQGWTPFPRQNGSFAARLVAFDATTFALELTGSSGPGGYAFPSQKFKRAGTNKQLRIRFTMVLKQTARVTVVEIGDQTGPAVLRIGIDGDKPFVEGSTTPFDFALPVNTPQPVELVVTASNNSTQLALPTLPIKRTLDNLPALPEELEVRFGATPLAGDSSLPGQTVVVIDDVVIE